VKPFFKTEWVSPPPIDDHLIQYQMYMNYVQSQILYSTAPSFTNKIEGLTTPSTWNDATDSAAYALAPQQPLTPPKQEPAKAMDAIRTCPHVCCNPNLSTNDLIVGKENEINQN
jgi:hypothetical protein